MIAPGGIRLYKQLAMLKSEEGRKLASTQQQILGLQHKTQLLQEDKQYQAYEARVVWELVKPGEQVVWYRDLEDE
jgi:cell division protein FtsB